ncbi:hypothetical protein EON67_06950 [archaeon]|nr:MAG: hypothetical protein EON67_06950 [archaeon]
MFARADAAARAPPFVHVLAPLFDATQQQPRVRSRFSTCARNHAHIQSGRYLGAHARACPRLGLFVSCMMLVNAAADQPACQPHRCAVSNGAAVRAHACHHTGRMHTRMVRCAQLRDAAAGPTAEVRRPGVDMAPHSLRTPLFCSCACITSHARSPPPPPCPATLV